jgi:putative transposase
LERASELAAAGTAQKDIADSLGISVMTYHRWRKSFHHRPSPQGENARPTDLDEAGRAAELQLENSLLRQLVTDLLLEKIQLEEQAGLTPSW